MTDNESVQNGIEFISGATNILLVAPHGVQATPYDDEKTAELTREIQRALNCYAIINPTFRKPDDTEKSKRNGGVPDLKNQFLDLNKINQAKLHPTFIPKIKKVVDKKGLIYVFWIHGIDDKNIKSGIECYVGCGQPNSKAKVEKSREARYTATQETIDGFLTQLNNVGIKTALAPEDSKYRGWSQDYMNQWLSIEGYTFEQAQSIQLEFKYTGIRKKDCTQPAGAKIAKAISTLLSVPFLPAVVEAKPVMDDVDDEKVEKAYEHIKGIFIKKFQETMLEIGQYLIKHFYDGDYDKAKSKPFTHNKSLKRLYERLETETSGNLPKKSWLYNSINLAIAENDFGKDSIYGKLSQSHKVLLAGQKKLDQKKKINLMERAVDGKWTVVRLQHEIKQEKSDKETPKIDIFNLPHTEVLMKQSPKILNQLKGRAEVLIQTYTDNLKTVKLADELINSAIETREPTRAELRKAIENNEWTVSRNNVNFQTGCSNACIYCYGRFMFNAEKLKEEAEAQGKEFHWGEVSIRQNDVDKNRGLKDGRVGFPTSHDITPENLSDYLTVLGKLLRAGNKILIITKPVLECIQGICNASEFFKEEILFRFTITAKSSDILKFWEPNAPSYEDRFECLKYAHAAGFHTSVSIEPMLEYSRAEEMVEEMLPYITDAVWFGKMNHIKSFDTPDDDLEVELEKVKAGHSDDNIKALYKIYRDNPKIKWKLAYKDVLGIALPPAPGMDI